MASENPMSSENAEMMKKLIDRIDALAQTNENLVQALNQLLPALVSGERRANAMTSSSVSFTSPSQPPVLPPNVNAARRHTSISMGEPGDFESWKKGTNTTGSVFTGEESEESAEDESFFVQEMLPPERFTETDLVKHLKDYKWEIEGRNILGNLPGISELDLFKNDRKTEAEEKRTEAEEHHANYSHANFYEINIYGEALAIPSKEKDFSKAAWHCLQTTNTCESKQQNAVGKIAIVREPSPLLLGAVHLAMNDHFDMDQILRILTDDSPSKAYMNGSLKADPRRQRSFIFSFKYHCIVGEGREPMVWQNGDPDLSETTDHIPMTTCSAIVALSFTGAPKSTLRRRSRRAKPITGQVFDPFLPWRVLSIQCFADWRSTVEMHEQNHHYVNGPEAFLVTLLAEYQDAQKRFMEINKHIVRMVTPPSKFMFDEELRDELLFENADLRYSKRYFWANQTLGVMNDSIQAMIRAYNDTFTEEVWNGDHKFIWPGNKGVSDKFNNFRKKLAYLRKQFEQTIKDLHEVLALNKAEQKDIKSLREQLFSGTSVTESREAIKMAKTTVQQGFNIKLLTLVSIFFLPLTFVTSVYGMTNIDPKMGFIPFGITLVTICAPTYTLILSLNSPHRLKIIRQKTEMLFRRIILFFESFLILTSYKRTPKIANPEPNVPQPGVLRTNANDNPDARWRKSVQSDVDTFQKHSCDDINSNRDNHLTAMDGTNKGVAAISEETDNLGEGHDQQPSKTKGIFRLLTFRSSRSGGGGVSIDNNSGTQSPKSKTLPV